MLALIAWPTPPRGYGPMGAAEIADTTGLSTAQIRAVHDVARIVTSLDRPIGEEEEATLETFVPAAGAGPEEEVELSLRREAVEAALLRLPELHRRVLVLRYGIDDDQPRGFAAVGRELGLTWDAVKRLETEALTELASARELDALGDAA